MFRNAAPEMLDSPVPGVIPRTRNIHGQVPDLSQPKAVEAQAPAASRPDRKDTRGGQAERSGSRRIAELRVRELERMHQGADARLCRAQEEHAPHSRG